MNHEKDFHARNWLGMFIVSKMIKWLYFSSIVFRYHQFVYGHLLGRYLEEKYTESPGKAQHKCQILMNICDGLNNLGKLCYQIVCSYNTDDIAQIVSEIYDLKAK